jgi:hypothetical protein
MTTDGSRRCVASSRTAVALFLKMFRLKRMFLDDTIATAFALFRGWVYRNDS